jgi:hypothetical protein
MNAISVTSLLNSMRQFRWETALLHEIEFPIAVGVLYALFCLIHRLVSGPKLSGPTPSRSLFTPSPLSVPSEKPVSESKKVREVNSVGGRILSDFISFHNLFLAGLSLIMFLGTIYGLYERSFELGSMEWIVCEFENANSNGILGFWAYIYYLSKYYELIDTILQLIRNKYPPHYFLHVYHHSLVILMSWMWLEYSPSLRFAGLLFNTLVHVVMYYYFYLKSIGVEPWWKSYVTTLQIIQFIFSLFLFMITLSLHHHIRGCRGMNYLYLNLVFNVTLLFGFIDVLGKNTSGRRGEKFD